uniref:Uncharacterized protein n=1 Tax=Triticum urartu TaxID=4572 RepID=A0A8R7V559_TRIUA
MVMCALAGAGPAARSSSAGTSAPGMRGRTTGRASAALMQRLRTPHATAKRRL